MAFITIIVHSRGDSLFVPLARDLAINYIRVLFGQYCHVIDTRNYLSMQNPFLTSGVVYTLGLSRNIMMGVDSKKYVIDIPDRALQKYLLVKGNHLHTEKGFLMQQYTVNDCILDVVAECIDVS